jgi:hypothetical protein
MRGRRRQVRNATHGNASSTRDATYLFATELDDLARFKVKAFIFDGDAILRLR